MARLNQSLDDETAVVADVGDALFAATELVVHVANQIHFAGLLHLDGIRIPAALGVQVAGPELRAVVIVGDGALQMTGMELSTIIRYGFPTIVIVLDNEGYGTERVLHPGSFNDINPWKYYKLPEILGGGTGYEVRTEGEFDTALRKAWADKSGMSLIQVHLLPNDHSKALHRLAERLSKKV